MPSFDIVSKTDMTSVDNALQGVVKEIQIRYDFKGSKSEVSKNDDVITSYHSYMGGSPVDPHPEANTRLPASVG